MIVTNDLLAKLRETIAPILPPDHCQGCDGYKCGGPDMSGKSEGKTLDDMVIAVAVMLEKHEPPIPPPPTRWERTPAFKCQSCGETCYFMGSFSAASYERQHNQFFMKHKLCLPTCNGGGI